MKKSKPNLIKIVFTFALVLSCLTLNLGSANAFNKTYLTSNYFAEAELYGTPTSGFVDDNGRPLSQEEYDKIKAEQEKGIFEKYPIPSAVVGLAIVGGILWLIRKKMAKR